MSELINLVGKCTCCGAPISVEVFSDDYEAYCDGKLAQYAFPYLSAQERDIIILQWCEQCWERYYGED